MRVYYIIAGIAFVLFCVVFVRTWIDGSQRKYSIGSRFTFWFPHLTISALFSWRFWRLTTHHVVSGVNGGVTRGSWGPVAFNSWPKDLE